MINTQELEKRWFKYKFKSYLLHLIIFVTSIVFILLLFIFVGTDLLKKPTELKKESTNIPKEKKIEKVIIQKTIIKKTPDVKIKKLVEVNLTSIIKNDEKQEKQPLIVEPSFNFISQIESDLAKKSIVQNRQISEKKDIQTQIIEVEKKEPKKTIQKEIQRKQPIQTVEKKRKPIHIVRQNTQEDIKAVIKRFEKNHNPALSLFIARQYYEIKEYKKAYNYALITNGINNDIEESWIIFAKSLVKLNERTIAIKMLKKYIQYSNSYRAITLLGDINSGKFR